MPTLKHTLIVMLILATFWIFIPIGIAAILWASRSEVYKGDTSPNLFGYLGGILYIASGPIAARAYLKWAGKEAAQAQTQKTEDRIGQLRIEREIMQDGLAREGDDPARSKPPSPLASR